MTAVLIALVVLLALATAALAAVNFRDRLQRPSRAPVTSTRRIL